jgi:glutamate racemase
LTIYKQNTSTSPIGIFDSGLGGLSIWKEINRLLPNESTIYLADSVNAPYGEKTKEQIVEFSIKNTELLLKLGCKLIVVACNTATTNAIKVLRDKYEISFIGIEPAIKPAALKTKTQKVGVLATRGTLNSDLFVSSSGVYRNELELIETEGKGLVQLIEDGRISETEELLKSYILPMVEKGVDNIVLGCSHYPFLIPIIEKFIPSTITIIDSGEAVAKQTHNVLNQEGVLNNSTLITSQFYTNGVIKLLNDFLKMVSANATEVEYKIF